MSERWVYLGRPGLAVAHAFLDVERGPLERLAVARSERHGIVKRMARCGASVRRADELSEEGAAARRCRACERRLAAGGEPRWLQRAGAIEVPERAPVVRVDDAASAFELAQRIARDVVRELSAADAPDYVREAMRSAAAGAALMVAERIGRAARGTRTATVVSLDGWRAGRAERTASHG